MHADAARGGADRGPAAAFRPSTPVRSAAADLVLGELAALEVVLEERVVGLGDRLEQPLAILAAVAVRSSGIAPACGAAKSALAIMAFIVTQVDVALEIARRRRSGSRRHHLGAEHLRATAPAPRRGRVSSRSRRLMKPIAGMPSSPHQPHTRSSSTFTSPCGREHEDGAGAAPPAPRASRQEDRVAGRVDDRELVLLPADVMDGGADRGLPAHLLGLDVEERGAVVGAAEARRPAARPRSARRRAASCRPRPVRRCRCCGCVRPLRQPCDPPCALEPIGYDDE